MTRPLRHFYDAEFVESGPREPVELLSIAVVDEFGGEFHRVLADADWERARAHPFVSEHVLPGINMVEGSLWKPRDVVARELLAFIDPGEGRTAQMWAWYAAYDHVVRSQLYGTMVELPQPAFPMYTRDLKQEVDRIEEQAGERIELYSPAAGEHDALVDSRVLRTRYQQVRLFAELRGVSGPQ